MKDVIINCFKYFKCNPKDCTHNCCTGWEIDVDKKTLKRYKKINGELSEKMKTAVDFNKGCFILDKDRRCPFLNKDNLCDIIINYGEKSLCKICTLHPRFKNFFSRHVETGVGISCPESAKLLFNFKDKLALSEKVSYTKREREVIEYRDNALNIVQDRNKGISKRINDLLLFTGVEYKKFFSCDYKGLYNKLEVLYEGFKDRINLIDVKGISKDDSLSIEKEQLLSYFIYRHVSRAVDLFDARTFLLFSVLSFLVIESVTKAQGGGREVLIDVSREYSEEIEYDEVNINKICDKLESFFL